MVTNVEFLDEDVLENVITCLNYQIDRVVYFGTDEMIRSYESQTRRFLTECCGVKEVVFYPLAQYDLQGILQVMRERVEREAAAGHDIYFDVTGGQSLVLVAFGMLAEQYRVPIHLFDVPSGRLQELDEGAGRAIGTDVPKREIRMNLKQYIQLQGGVINERLQKDIKEIEGNPDPEYVEDVRRIWHVARQYGEYWNNFSALLRKLTSGKTDLAVSHYVRTVISSLKEMNGKLRKISDVNAILTALARENLIQDLELKPEKQTYKFRYKNEQIRECLLGGGTILELYMYLQEKETADDCRAGVHLDWDGTIHEKMADDVLNEIDVFSIKDNIPTFISCKSGGTHRYDLYELDTVGKRFGGKYARKILATVQEMTKTDQLRAVEMGIEIRNV